MVCSTANLSGEVCHLLYYYVYPVLLFLSRVWDTMKHLPELWQQGMEVASLMAMDAWVWLIVEGNLSNNKTVTTSLFTLCAILCIYLIKRDAF